MARESEALQAYDASPWASIAITASDSDVISPIIREVFVGGAGNLAVRMLDGSTPIFSGLPASSFLPLQIDKVLATGTTATNIIGLSNASGMAVSGVGSPIGLLPALTYAA